MSDAFGFWCPRVFWMDDGQILEIVFLLLLLLLLLYTVKGWMILLVEKLASKPCKRKSRGSELYSIRREELIENDGDYYSKMISSVMISLCTAHHSTAGNSYEPYNHFIKVVVFSFLGRWGIFFAFFYKTLHFSWYQFKIK